jgi:hypothetical protein
MLAGPTPQGPAILIPLALDEGSEHFDLFRVAMQDHQFEARCRWIFSANYGDLDTWSFFLEFKVHKPARAEFSLYFPVRKTFMGLFALTQGSRLMLTPFSDTQVEARRSLGVPQGALLAPETPGLEMVLETLNQFAIVLHASDIASNESADAGK